MCYFLPSLHFFPLIYIRDTSVRPSVERVLKIWQERKVFEKDIVQKLFEQLNNGIIILDTIILYALTNNLDKVRVDLK